MSKKPLPPLKLLEVTSQTKNGKTKHELWWTPMEEHDDASLEVRLRVEPAPSSRAKCKKCSFNIPKNELRIGRPVKWKGIIPVWCHLKCFFQESPQDQISLQTQIHGLDTLTNPQIVEVQAALARTTAPAHIITLSPDDPSFQPVLRNLPQRPTPSNITMDLLPFQQEGYGWMVAQERQQQRGGILADEMGMGKTIQTISLIVENAPLKRGPTLIVAPTSAMMQWHQEIENNTKEKTLSILVYHGTTRKDLVPKDLMDVDVVLTSYPVLEAAFRRAANAQKTKCEYCSKMFMPHKLRFHHEYFCGPHSKRTYKQQKQEKQHGVAQSKLARQSHATIMKGMRALGVGGGE